MPAYLDTLNKILSLGTIGLQVLCVVLLIVFFFFPRENGIRVFFKQYAFLISFLLALSGTALSLFYSDFIGFPACELCWIYRIFLYPQVILLGMSLYRRDRSILDYSIVLMILGVITNVYHVYIENGGESSLPCASPTAVNQVSCATRYVYEYGYITIPVMALTVSVLILLLLINYKHLTRKLNV